MHNIPETLIVSGLLYKVKQADDQNAQGVDYGKGEIRYTEYDNQDRTVTEILGMVMTIMLDASGTLPLQGNKISIEANQLIRILRHNLFCFLRDNPVDWRMVSLRMPLLMQQTLQPQEAEMEHQPAPPQAETLEQTATEAISEINRMDYSEADETQLPT